MEDEEVMTVEETDFDDWDDIDIDLASEAEDEEPAVEAAPEEADQPTEGDPTEEAAEEPESTEPAPELFELKHLGETKSVNRDEIVTLAQKGLNYDHIREERDSAKAEVARLKELEDFLKELAAESGGSVEDLIIDTQAARMVQQDAKLGKTTDKELAREKVRLQRDRAALEKQKAEKTAVDAEAAQKQAKINDGIKRFAQAHPDLKAEEIPKEIWDKVADGGDLGALWNEHENRQLKATIAELQSKLKTKEQNEKNKQRAVGSQKTAGAAPQKDPWFDGWDDD